MPVFNPLLTTYTAKPHRTQFSSYINLVQQAIILRFPFIINFSSMSLPENLKHTLISHIFDNGILT
jgi:hypothetical protein